MVEHPWHSFAEFIEQFDPSKADLDDWLYALGSPGRVVGTWDTVFAGKRFTCTTCGTKLTSAETPSENFSQIRFHKTPTNPWCGAVGSDMSVGQMYDDLLNLWEKHE